MSQISSFEVCVCFISFEVALNITQYVSYETCVIFPKLYFLLRSVVFLGSTSLDWFRFLGYVSRNPVSDLMEIFMIFHSFI